MVRRLFPSESLAFSGLQPGYLPSLSKDDAIFRCRGEQNGRCGKHFKVVLSHV